MQLERVRPLPQVPEWEQIATRVYELRRAGRCEAAARSTRRSRRSIADVDRDAGEAALDAGARGRATGEAMTCRRACRRRRRRRPGCFSRPRSLLHRRLLLPAGRRRARSSASPTSTSTRSATRTTRASSARATTRGCCNPGFWQRAQEHLLLRARRRAAHRRRLARRGAAGEREARALQAASSAPIYFAPFVTTLVAVAIVWRYLYHPRYGLLNYALGACRHRRRSTGSATRTGRCRPSS